MYGRIRHYPWPDHHPPPFALIPNIMASMRDWLQGCADKDGKTGNVAVVHCKAGKGRSGTVACSYLISEEGWAVDDALVVFTARRMRSGFGSGVSIPSQLRWVGYVANWVRHGKCYVERRVEVLEVHVWGLKEGVKVGINGYVDEGKTIKTFHIFGKTERIVVNGSALSEASFARTTESYDEKALPLQETAPRTNNTIQTRPNQDRKPPTREQTGSEQGGEAVIFRPSSRIILPSNDIDIDFERRNKAGYGWTMVTSVAHVWFNAFFECRSRDTPGLAASDGVFEINWENMDGIKGSAQKGVRALDRLAVVWRAVPEVNNQILTTRIITEPLSGAPIPQTAAADWKGAHVESRAALGKDLGLRTETPVSATVSKASSIASPQSLRPDEEPAFGVKTHGINGEDHIPHDWGAILHHEGQSVSLPSLPRFDVDGDPDSPQAVLAENGAKRGEVKDTKT